MSSIETKTKLEIVTHSPEDTVAAGRTLAQRLVAPSLVLLEGELGSGKTTLVKGLVVGLGVAREEEVTSPSFTLVHEYSSPAREAGQGGAAKAAAELAGGHPGVEGGAAKGPWRVGERKVYHVDLYRIDDPRELETLGLEDLLAQEAIVIVEWGEKLGERAPAAHVSIRMEYLGNEERRITVEGMGA